MSLTGPTSEDIEKIHAEVNQIVNQRLMLTTLAVTVFGAMVAWLIPKFMPVEEVEMGPYAFVASAILLLILFVLFLLSHHLTYMLRVFTTYLAETSCSGWEMDWYKYRKQYGYWGYTRPQTIVFLVLGMLAALMPFCLFHAYLHSIELLPWELLSGGVGVAYLLLVWCMGFCRFFTGEDAVRDKWEKLKQ